jgi:ABC-type Fe3+ transport system substrate-binding protein
MMTRSLLFFLFGLLLLMPLVLRRMLLPPREAASNGLRLVIVTSHNRDIRREFARAFDHWHRQRYGTGVTLDYRTPGGTSDVERMLGSMYDAYRDSSGKLPPNVSTGIDVVWGGGDFFFDQQLKPLGILQPMRLDPNLLQSAFPLPTLAGVRLYDKTTDANGVPTPQWIGVCLSSFGIICNPDVYDALQMPIPTTWNNLTDSRLAGFIALADPSHSASAAVAYMMVIQRGMADAEEALFQREPALRSMPKAKLNALPEYQAALAGGWKHGMDELTLIAANARYFTDSSEMVPNDVSRGEAAAGVAIDFYAYITEQVVGLSRARFVLPERATAITPDPVAILYGVNNGRLTLAQHFVEFLLSPEGQRLWILRPGTQGGPIERALMRMPVRWDVYTNQQGWGRHGDPFLQAGGFNERGEWMALMTETRLIWLAAWIDSRDEMESAYRAARSVADPGRRAELIAKLADLPIEMSDVADLHTHSKTLGANQIDEWRTRTEIAWAEKFRRHYRAVKESAL